MNNCCHPNECKFWLRDTRFMGQECKYLHWIENKGKSIEKSGLSCNINDEVKNEKGYKIWPKKEYSENLNTTNEKEKNTCNSSDIENEE